MQVNDTEFHASVLSSDQPVLVDFWASWCPPCKMMEPMVDRLTDQLADRVRIVKVNVDRNPVTAANYKIQNLPTFVLFQNGQEVARRTGAQTENQLRALADLAGAPRADAQAPEIVVVTGLPRAGAGLMTRLLEAGGVPSHTSHDAEDRGSKAANAVRATQGRGMAGTRRGQVRFDGAPPGSRASRFGPLPGLDDAAASPRADGLATSDARAARRPDYGG